MSERKDLTRWNRAGLTRFRYVDGNAVEYLELLRQKLVAQFADSKTGSCAWLNPPEIIPANEAKQENETLIQRHQRLSLKQKRILETYHQDRRDWTWEITRSFARSCHILTEYANAYANEGYLGTATQWDHVRRLVEMLDYHPAPPASASTRLVFIAKGDKPGVVAKGFQVKNSPPTGGDKVIFETLEDLVVDSALNELRPKGWNRSDEPAAEPTDSIGDTQPPEEGKQFSAIANGPAINLQGVGETRALKLNTLSDSDDFKIKDFLNLDPAGSSDLGIGINMLKELKAKATFISNFEFESGWSDVVDWLLPRIAAERPELLAEITGNAADIAKSFQQRIELIGAFLDPDIYENAKLGDLIAPEDALPGAVVTAWQVKPNTNVSPRQVAMIYRELRDEIEDKYFDEAEAATIAGIEKQTKSIHLKPSPLQDTWTNWSKGEARLKVAPRWKRKCWLNGNKVIRTEEPHGLSAESYISWKIDYDLEIGDLVDEGRSLVNVALVAVGENEQLCIRIFNENGEMVVDKTENAANVENELLGKPVLDALKSEIKRLLDAPGISQRAKQNIIEKAISCARYTQWKHAKVSEADKRDLRLEVTGPLPQEGADLYELRPIEGSILPAGYEAIVLFGGEDDMPPDVESVTPMIEASPELDNLEPIFCLRKVLPAELKTATGAVAEGGGLLPPASLPEIGCFLFPSPMLPLDLVKAAVELMLSMGVMAIPSTGEIVFKGMPFGGLLAEAGNDPKKAAKLLFDMLEKLEGVVQEHNENCEPLWKLKVPPDGPGGSATYNQENDADYERDENDNLVPSISDSEKLVKWNEKYKNSDSDSDPDSEDFNEKMIKEDLEEMLSLPEGKEATILFQKLTEDIIGKGPLLAIPKEPTVQAVVQASDPLYMFDGSSKIGGGDWVVCKFSDGHRALKVSNIEWFSDSDKSESFSLSFENLDVNKELKKVYADFRSELVAQGSAVNITDVDPDNLELEEVPESLKVGCTVLLTGCSDKAVAAEIIAIDGTVIKTNPPATGCAKGNLIIRGNVVLAGHGESKPAKILGSGDASKSNQEFRLKVEDVSFTPDVTKSSGVAAAIEVEVAGRVWQQVSTLKDSAPGDHHYAIRMTEDGYLKILFGDGEYGRRLPTGKNNIRVSYRVGSGIVGNLPAGSLEKPVNPHPLVETVLQPIQAAGGGDMEDVASLRENAPSTLLALERAVSLSDFSHLGSQPKQHLAGASLSSKSPGGQERAGKSGDCPRRWGSIR